MNAINRKDTVLMIAEPALRRDFPYCRGEFCNILKTKFQFCCVCNMNSIVYTSLKSY